MPASRLSVSHRSNRSLAFGHTQSDVVFHTAGEPIGLARRILLYRSPLPHGRSVSNPRRRGASVRTPSISTADRYSGRQSAAHAKLGHRGVGACAHHRLVDHPLCGPRGVSGSARRGRTRTGWRWRRWQQGDWWSGQAGTHPVRAYASTKAGAHADTAGGQATRTQAAGGATPTAHTPTTHTANTNPGDHTGGHQQHRVVGHTGVWWWIRRRWQCRQRTWQWRWGRRRCGYGTGKQRWAGHWRREWDSLPACSNGAVPATTPGTQQGTWHDCGDLRCRFHRQGARFAFRAHEGWQLQQKIA